MKTILKITKWVSAVSAVLIVGLFATVYFTSVDSHDAALWTAWTMGLLGLAFGAILSRGE